MDEQMIIDSFDELIEKWSKLKESFKFRTDNWVKENKRILQLSRATDFKYFDEDIIYYVKRRKNEYLLCYCKKEDKKTRTISNDWSFEFHNSFWKQRIHFLTCLHAWVTKKLNEYEYDYEID